MFVTHRVGSTEKAERLLRFRATIPLEEGLRSVVDWRRRGSDRVGASDPACMRVLVTGATGLLEAILVPRLARPTEVIALVHRPPETDLRTVKTIVADLANPSFTARLPKDVDVLVHLAQTYKTFPEHATEIFAVNATSTLHLADHARSAGIRHFIFPSSGSVYGPARELLRETDEPKPIGFHPATKTHRRAVAGALRWAYRDAHTAALRPVWPGSGGSSVSPADRICAKWLWCDPLERRPAPGCNRSSSVI